MVPERVSVLEFQNSTDKYQNTIFFSVPNERQKEIRRLLDEVYYALREKGYNPVSQLVGYVMSGDPTYITNYKNARSLITKIERDELVEELFQFYIAEMTRKNRESQG